MNNALITRVIPSLLSCCCLLLSSLGCSQPDDFTGRAIVIAVDGATNRVIAPMMQEGLLPHLSAIKDSGVMGPIRAHRPLLSPRIWTSVATGKIPERHGIQGWVWKDRRGTFQLYSSSDRRSHAIWNIFSDKGRIVGVVNWLNTQPPEKINGVMITDFAFPVLEDRLQLAGVFAKAKGKVARPDSASASFAFPEEWMNKVAELERDSGPASPIENPFHDGGLDFGENFNELFSGYFEKDTLSTHMALAIQEEIHPDLLLVYLPGIDRISHFIWPGQEPVDAYPEDRRLPPEALEKMHESLWLYYRHVDELIGRLMKGYTEDDLIIVLSDHGFEVGDSRMAGGHESDAALNGIFYARGKNIPAKYRLGPKELSVNDITPTVLSWFGLPVARDMQGKPAPFLDVPRPRMIDTYDTTPIERLEAGDTRGAEGAIKEQLKALGYIDED